MCYFENLIRSCGSFLKRRVQVFIYSFSWAITLGIMNTAMLVQFPRWFGENRLAFFNLLIIHQYLFPPFPFSNQTCVHEQTHRERGKFDSPFLCLVNILFQYTQGKMRYRKANSDYLSSRLKPRESLETKTKEKQWQGWCTLHLCSVASVMSDSSAHQAPLSVGFSRREY